MTKQITPQQVRKLRLRVNKTPVEAANDVHVSVKTWQGWEAPEGASSNRKMPQGYVELFCIKNKIAYPPKF